METKALEKYSFFFLFTVGIMLGAGSVLAQVEKMERPVSVGESEERFIGCPSPINLNLNASTPNVFNGDFSTAMLSNYQDQLGYSGTNKFYLHTFQWKSRPCCECSSAVLTVKMKANSAGISPKSADAGNDTISVVHNGVTIPGYGGAVYSGPFPFSIGQQATKTFNLSGVALKTMCKEGPPKLRCAGRHYGAIGHATCEGLLPV